MTCESSKPVVQSARKAKALLVKVRFTWRNVFVFESSNLVLRLEIPSGMCVKLRTVAASNNRDHPTRSLSSSRLARTINCSPSSQALEVTDQDRSIGITLLLLVRATHVWCFSSRTSRSWWITHLTQRHRRGCNTGIAMMCSHCSVTARIKWFLKVLKEVYSLHFKLKPQRNVANRAYAWVNNKTFVCDYQRYTNVQAFFPTFTCTRKI